MVASERMSGPDVRYSVYTVRFLVRVELTDNVSDDARFGSGEYVVALVTERVREPRDVALQFPTQ